MADPLRYSIFDPTGNITALVETPVGVPRQPAVAADIMRRHPEVEQVGFLTFPRTFSSGEGGDKSRMRSSAELPSLRMAGGEFCGNASMCAAALFSLRRPVQAFSLRERRHSASHTSRMTNEVLPAGPDNTFTLPLQVSGSQEPVEVRLRKETGTAWFASIKMPPAQRIERKEFRFGDLLGTLPLVRMEGISHLIVEPDTAFFTLLDDRPAAEEAARQWARDLKVPGLGLMFLESEVLLTPLVFIPASDTIFWENSCASGSTAVGMALSDCAAKPVSLSLKEPGGTLRVESSPGGPTILHGHTKLIAEYEH